VAEGRPPEFTRAPRGAVACDGQPEVVFEAEIDFADATDLQVSWAFNPGAGFAALADGDRGGRITILVDLADPRAVITSLSITDADALIDAGIYRCVATGSDGETTMDAALSFHPPPAVAPTADPEQVCLAIPVSLSANPTGSDPDNQLVVWSVQSGPNTSGQQFSNRIVHRPTFRATNLGTYVLKVETFDCDESADGTVTIEVFGPLSVNPTPAQGGTCVGKPVQLRANPSGGASEADYEFEWTVIRQPVGDVPVFVPGNQAANPVLTPFQAGTYELEVIVRADGCDESDPGAVIIDVTDALIVEASALSTELCLGDGTLLRAVSDDPNLEYAWAVTTGPATNTAQFSNVLSPFPFFTPSAAGDYVLGVTVRRDDCSPGQDDLAITVHNALTVAPRADPATVCLGESASLSAAATGSGSANQQFTWRIIGGPSTNIGQLSGVFTATPSFAPNAATTVNNPYVLKVDVADFVCDDLVSGQVSVPVLARVTADPSAQENVACQGVPVRLDANAVGGSGAYTYGWSISIGPGTTAQFNNVQAGSPLFTPAAGGITYRLALDVDDAACDATQPVYFLSLPVVNAITLLPSAEFPATLVNVPLTLNANLTGGVDPKVNWNVAARPVGCVSDSPLTGANTTNPTFTPACAGIYTLTVGATDDVCNDVVTTLKINVVRATAAPSADPPSLGTCGGPTSSLLSPNVDVAFGPYDYTWMLRSGPDTDDAQLSDTEAETPLFTPTAAGTYTIEVSARNRDAMLPPITGQVDIVVSAVAPSIPVGGQPTSQSVCTGGSTALTVAASGSDLAYQWRRGGIDLRDATTASLTIDPVRPADAGDYTCVVSNACGSVESDVAALTVESGIGLLLLAVSTESAMLREVNISGCTITGDLRNRADLAPGAARVNGLAYDPLADVLYAAVRPDGDLPETWLATLDPTSGDLVMVATMGEPIADLAVDPAGVLYAARGNASPVGAFQKGEIVRVDPATAAPASLDPVLSFGDVEGHSIAFDSAGVLYHHGRNANVYSRLSRVTLSPAPGTPHSLTVVKSFNVPYPILRAMTVARDGLILAATQDFDLWSIDPKDNYAVTTLGTTRTSGGTSVSLTGLAFVPTVQLVLHAVATARTVNAGEQVTYTFTAVNLGDRPATAVQLRDTIAPGETFVSAAFVTGSGQVGAPDPCAGCTITWTLDDPLTSQQSLAVELVVRIDDDVADQTELTHERFEAGSAECEVVPGPVLTTTVRHTALHAFLSADATLSGGGVIAPGETIRYGVTVNNTGLDAFDVAWTLDWPPDLLPVAGSVTTTVGTVTSNDPLRIEIGTLGSPDDPVVIAFEAALSERPRSASVCLQGTIRSGSGSEVRSDDPWMPGDADPTCVAVCGPGDFDCGGTVDLEDYAWFVRCMPVLTLPDDCRRLDDNGDGRLNLRDWAVFQWAFSGS